MQIHFPGGVRVRERGKNELKVHVNDLGLLNTEWWNGPVFGSRIARAAFLCTSLNAVLINFHEIGASFRNYFSRD